MLRAGSGEQTSYFEVLRDTQQREVVYPGVMLRAWKEGLTGGRYKQGRKYHHNRKSVGDFPGGPVVRVPRFHCCGSGFVGSLVGELRCYKPRGQNHQKWERVESGKASDLALLPHLPHPAPYSEPAGLGIQTCSSLRYRER